MSAAYWDQWDKTDIASWQGNDIASIEGKDEDGEDIQSLKLEEEFSYGMFPSMDDLGMCMRDFM